MKKRKEYVDLNVDFIGGGVALTIEEEKAISDFIKAAKLRRAKIEKRALAGGRLISNRSSV